MFWHAIIWIGLGFWALLWTGLCWLLGRFIGAAQPGSDGAGLPGWFDTWRIPAWLAQWLPMGWITEWKVWLIGIGDWLALLWDHAPLLMGFSSPALWLLWLAGIACLVVVGLALSAMVAALLKKPAPAPVIVAAPPMRAGEPGDIESPRP